MKNLLIVIVMIVFFAACGGGGGSEEQEKKTIFPEITFLSAINDLNVGSDITFSAVNSYVTEGNIRRYEWRVLIDDNRVYYAEDPEVIHTYRVEGEGHHRVELTVFDDNYGSETTLIDIGEINYKTVDLDCVSMFLDIGDDIDGVACASFSNGWVFGSETQINNRGQAVTTWQSNGGNLGDIYFAFFDGQNWSAQAYVTTYQCCGNGANVELNNEGQSAFFYVDNEGKFRLAYFDQHNAVYETGITGDLIGHFIDDFGIVTVLSTEHNGSIIITRLNRQGLISTDTVSIDDFAPDSPGSNLRIFGHSATGNIAIRYHEEFLIRIIDGELIYTVLPRRSDPIPHYVGDFSMRIQANGDVDIFPKFTSYSGGEDDYHYRIHLDGSFSRFNFFLPFTEVGVHESDENIMAYIARCTDNAEVSLICPSPGYWLNVFNGQYWQATYQYDGPVTLQSSDERINSLHYVKNGWVYMRRDPDRLLKVDFFSQGTMEKSVHWPLVVQSESTPSYSVSQSGYITFAGMLGDSQENRYSGYSMLIVSTED